MTIGPVQALVIGFPSNDLFEGRIAEELARLSDVGQIRIIDAVFVMRDGDARQNQDGNDGDKPPSRGRSWAHGLPPCC